MDFCASCGRPRSEDARFCGTCGSEFKDSPDDQGTPGDAADRPGPVAGVTHTDVVAELPDIPPAATDSFRSWYQPAPPAAGESNDVNWGQTQTVQATPTQASGHPPTAFTPGNPFSSAHPVVTPPVPPGRSYPPGPQTAPPGRSGGGKGLFIALAVIVVLAAGGGAYALATTLGKHSTAQPSISPTVGASTSASGTTPPASGSTTPTPSPTLSLVAVSPGVTANTAEPQVETLLSNYFQGINTHSYPEYASTLNAAEQAKQTEAQFTSGYSSTTDSGMTLTALAGNSDGSLTATVTFTSRQSPAQSVDNSACNAWTLNFYLVQGSGYLIGPAPSGYQPTYSDC